MKRHVGVRVINNGMVQFFGKTYQPDGTYNGELDGQKWYFIAYEPDRNMLAMWGDEQRYRSSMESEEAYEADCSRRLEKNIAEDGTILWYFWKEIV